MNLRVSADQAGWSIREAAGASRSVCCGAEATQRAPRSSVPARPPSLCRGFDPDQTHLARSPTPTAPVAARPRRCGGRLHRFSPRAVAIAAGRPERSRSPDQMLASGADESRRPRLASGAGSRPSPPRPRLGQRWCSRESPRSSSPAHAAPATPPPAVKPTEKPAQVAWDFAQAFVAYEVGRSDEEVRVRLRLDRHQAARQGARGRPAPPARRAARCPRPGSSTSSSAPRTSSR